MREKWQGNKRGVLAVSVLVLALLSLSIAINAQVQHGIRWTWQPVTQDIANNPITVDGYNIYCAPSAAGPFTAKNNSALVTATNYLQTGLTIGSTQFCQITAVKGNQEGGHSASGSATFQFPPAAGAVPVGVAE